MTAQHSDWDKLWKRIQYRFQHNPAWLRKNINRRVKQIVCSARVQQRTNVTAQYPKHPDWDKVWTKVRYWNKTWLEDYIQSHDINQCTDEQGNTLLHCAVRDGNLGATTCLFDLFIDPNIKNAAGQTALRLAQDTVSLLVQDAEFLEYLHEYHLCIDFDKASAKLNGLDALFAAIYRGDATLGDTSGVEDDGNEKNAGGWTALYCAVVYDRPHLIRALHQRFPKLDMGFFNQSYCRSLRLAAMYGHSNCIIALCESFPAIEARDALRVTCEYNLSACIPTLRQYFPQLTGNELIYTYAYSSALMCATLHHNPECIRALHSCFPDIDPNLQDIHGNTALFAAVNRTENSNCIPVLSECFPKIDPNKQNNDGNTALTYACKQSITLLATYFPSIDVNLRNKQGKTALMLAINHNNEKCLIALCESFPNIDPTIQDDNGDTALMVAIRRYNANPVISQLHRFFPNIDPNKQDKFGRTALMVAALCTRNPEPIISQLRKLFPNIDPNKQDKDQNTVLMYLLRRPNCSVESERHSLDTFPNVKQDEDQNTALMLLLKSLSGSVESVIRLLDTFPNVDVDIQNAKGETALMIAIEKGNAAVVALLLERFPDISFVKSTRQTALMLAIKKKHTNLLFQVLKHISQVD